MKFVKRETLNEAEVNPLETNTVDLTYDEQYKQAILNVIGSETSAHVEYDQILSIESKVSQKWLVDHFHDTLVDIRDEEMKHVAQLTTKVSELPELKDAFDAGVKEAETGEDTDDTDNDDKESEENEDKSKKESVLLTEAVTPNREYSIDAIQSVLMRNLGLSKEQDYAIFEVLSDMGFYSDDKDLTAEEVDKFIAEMAKTLNLSPEIVDKMEDLIIQTKSTADNRAYEDKINIEDDIDALEALFREDSRYYLKTAYAQRKIGELIRELENLTPDGKTEI